MRSRVLRRGRRTNGKCKRKRLFFGLLSVICPRLGKEGKKERKKRKEKKEGKKERKKKRNKNHEEDSVLRTS